MTSLGWSKRYQYDLDIKLGSYFTVSVCSSFSGLQIVLETISARKSLQPYLHRPKDHADGTSLGEAFPYIPPDELTRSNMGLELGLTSKVDVRKIELCTWRSFIISGPSFCCALAGLQGLWRKGDFSSVATLQFKYFTKTPLTYPTSSVVSERCPTRWKLASVLVCRATKVKCLGERRC